MRKKPPLTEFTLLEKLRGRARWLNERGGRTERDVLKDENGEFVLMTNGYEDVKVYLTYQK